MVGELLTYTIGIFQGSKGQEDLLTWLGFELSGHLLCAKVVYFFTESVGMGKICAFFGHRHIPSGLEPEIEKAATKLIDEEDVDTFWVGGYGEFDKVAASCIRSLRTRYPYVRLVLIAAYVQQLHAYGDIFPFDAFDYPAEAEAAPRKFAISARNRYVAVNADFVIAYVCKDYGGAFEAVRAAEYHGKTLLKIKKPAD